MSNGSDAGTAAGKGGEAELDRLLTAGREFSAEFP